VRPPFWQVACSESLAYLKAEVPDCSVDAVVTDPPYELGMMGHAWDVSGIAYSVEFWREVLRVMKPGAHLFSFGGTRTSHRMACAVEDAGFTVRDSFVWIQASGYSKSLDLGKAFEKANGVEPIGEKPASLGMASNPDWNACNRQLVMPETQTAEGKKWAGFGTSVKPFNEPILLAMKPPSERNFVENLRRWGTGALNVGACRLEPDAGSGGTREGEATAERRYDENGVTSFAPKPGARGGDVRGRLPSNVILDEEVAADLDSKTGHLKRNGSLKGTPYKGNNHIYNEFPDRGEWESYPDSDGASRYFFVAKTSTSERDAGCAEGGIPPWYRKDDVEKESPRYNTHITVKPQALMRRLVRLVCPPGGLLLDCFAGSGSTGVAAIHEGFDFLGIEQDSGYVEIARARIGHEAKKHGGVQA
jgi:site-specific DNA-methyltransferase (adenine-specific)